MTEEFLRETDRLIKERPQAREVLSAFRDLAALMTEETPTAAKTPLDDHLRDIKREEGFPLFSRADLPVDMDSAARLLRKFLETLRSAKRPDSSGIEAALRAMDTPDGGWNRSLFTAILKNDEAALQDLARGVGLETQVLEFLAQTALKPSIQAMRNLYAPGIDTETWEHGYCPFCGSLPSISFFDKTGKRFMHCGLCGLEWRFPRLRCPFCSNEDHKNLGYFDVERQEGFRVDFCRQCRRYIKTVDKRVFEKTGPMDLENLASLHLDILATKEGFK
jgi:FdhE protein